MPEQLKTTTMHFTPPPPFLRIKVEKTLWTFDGIPNETQILGPQIVDW